MAETVYIGGYGSGVLVAGRAPGGALTPVRELPATAPSFVAAHPFLPVLYAVGETGEGTVTAFGEQETQSRPSEGASPCHLAVDPTGGWLAVTNYGDGVVSIHPLGADGLFAGPAVALPNKGSGPNLDRQEGPHAHQAVFGPDGVLHVSDLGTDEIRRYRAPGELLPPVSLAPGIGPRHFARDPESGRWFVAGELDGLVHVYDAGWRELTSAPASRAGDANHPSHLELHQGLLYVGNRGPNTISVLDPDALERIEEVPSGGDWPRHFAFIGGDLYVANQNSGDVALFHLEGGIPVFTGTTLAVTGASCVI